MEDKLTSGEAYTFTLLEEWKQILQLGKQFEINYLNGRCDSMAINEHIGTLTTFYDALAPKVHTHKGTPKWEDLIKEFDDWQGWADNPTWFQSSNSMDAIKQFKRMLGDVVEKLDVTYFPEARTE